MDQKQPTSAASNCPAVHNEHNLSFTENGTPFHAVFNDVYFNQNNGAEESTYVYLNGNKLSERFSIAQGVFSICELGFGTGLNFLLTAKLWQETAPEDAQLIFYSVEKFPLSLNDIQAALAPWEELTQTGIFEQFSTQYQPNSLGWQKIIFNNITLHLAIGDAAEQLPTIKKAINAWFLDGFAPAKNPDMWTPKLFEYISELTPSGGTFSTFTAAGQVKEGLKNSGFNIERIKGYAYKRHMLVGNKK